MVQPSVLGALAREGLQRGGYASQVGTIITEKLLVGESHDVKSLNIVAEMEVVVVGWG